MDKKFELKPCPFCGSERVRYENSVMGKANILYGYIVCKDCGATSGYVMLYDSEPVMNAKIVTTEMWNRRANAPQPEAQPDAEPELEAVEFPHVVPTENMMADDCLPDGWLREKLREQQDAMKEFLDPEPEIIRLPQMSEKVADVVAEIIAKGEQRIAERDKRIAELEAKVEELKSTIQYQNSCMVQEEAQQRIAELEAQPNVRMATMSECPYCHEPVEAAKGCECQQPATGDWYVDGDGDVYFENELVPPVELLRLLEGEWASASVLIDRLAGMQQCIEELEAMLPDDPIAEELGTYPTWKIVDDVRREQDSVVDELYNCKVKGMYQAKRIAELEAQLACSPQEEVGWLQDRVQELEAQLDNLGGERGQALGVIKDIYDKTTSILNRYALLHAAEPGYSEDALE